MGVYHDAVDAYRDTTKWLTAFAPVAAIGTAGLALAAPLIRSIQGAEDLGSWATEHQAVIAGGLLLVAGVAVILVMGARVLSAAPRDIARLDENPKMSNAVATAIGDGILAPGFLTKDDFESALAKHLADQDQGNAIDDASRERMTTAVEALREWAVFNQVKARFWWFAGGLVVGLVAILAAFLLVPAELSGSSPFTKPTAVKVELDRAGNADLRTITGCSAADRTDFYAVGGTWAWPELAVDGPDCRFDARWWPPRGTFEVLPAP